MLTTTNVGGWCAAVHHSPGTAEPFHEETDTSAHRAWIVLGLWRRASGARHVVAATSRCRTSECCWRRGRQNSSLAAACEPRIPSQYGFAIVYTRYHKCVNEGCCWPSDQWLPDTTNLPEMKKQAALTAETGFSRLRSDDIVTPRTRTCPLALMVSPPSLIAGPQPPSL